MLEIARNLLVANSGTFQFLRLCAKAIKKGHLKLIGLMAGIFRGEIVANLTRM